VGYQSWLKSSGMGAYLEAYGGGDTGKREQGSYMANRCCDLARWVFCLQKESGNGSDDDENDHTSEARERRKQRRDAANSAPAREGKPLERMTRVAHMRSFFFVRSFRAVAAFDLIHCLKWRAIYLFSQVRSFFVLLLSLFRLHNNDNNDGTAGMMPESFFSPSTSGGGASSASDVEAGGVGAEASPLLGDPAILSQYAPDRS